METINSHLVAVAKSLVLGESEKAKIWETPKRQFLVQGIADEYHRYHHLDRADLRYGSFD